MLPMAMSKVGKVFDVGMAMCQVGKVFDVGDWNVPSWQGG